MDLNPEAGAEASTEAADTSVVQEDGGGLPPHFPPNYDEGGAEVEAAAGNVEPAAPETEAAAEAPVDDKPALPPLTPEEYQKRHDNINVALRESRQRERATRDEVAQLKSQMDQMRTSQPQAFERFIVEANLKDYASVDWQAWHVQDPEKAQEEYRNYQTIQARKEALDQQDQAATQQRQQQENQQRVNAMVASLNEQEEAFRQIKPDYNDAAAYLREVLTKEANAQGYFGEQAVRMVTDDILEVGLRVQAAGQDMAEFGYNLAVQRGYQPPAAAAPAPVNLEPIIAGQAAAKTISDVGTASGEGGGSFEERMAGLSGAAARKFWDKAKREQHN